MINNYSKFLFKKKLFNMAQITDFSSLMDEYNSYSKNLIKNFIQNSKRLFSKKLEFASVSLVWQLSAVLLYLTFHSWNVTRIATVSVALMHSKNSSFLRNFLCSVIVQAWPSAPDNQSQISCALTFCIIKTIKLHYTQ